MVEDGSYIVWYRNSNEFSIMIGRVAENSTKVQILVGSFGTFPEHPRFAAIAGWIPASKTCDAKIYTPSHPGYAALCAWEYLAREGSYASAKGANFYLKQYAHLLNQPTVTICHATDERKKDETAG